MRYALRAKVEGTLRIAEDFSVEVSGLRTDFERGDQGLLESVVVSAEVDASRFGATIGPGQGASKATITIESDDEVSSRLWTHLQALESHLAFCSGGAIERIRWDEPEELRIAETEEEKQRVSIPSVKRGFGNPRPQATLPAKAAKQIVEAAQRSDDDLVILKAFWREGMNDYIERRYVQAYYNFYFVVEGLYADGKSSKQQVLKAFQRSPEMREISEWVFDLIRRDPVHWREMREHFVSMDCTKDAQGAQALLFEIRGALHHYSPKSRRAKADPLSEVNFHSPSWFAMSFAQMALLKRDPGLPYALPNGQWKPLD